jgi:dihydrofolate synthase/folylpolyglutamate synthase
VRARSSAGGRARGGRPARIAGRGAAPLLVVDAAHNVASMQSLLSTLAPALAARRPRVLVFAASADKQIEEMLAAAAGRFDRVVVTRYLTNPRAAPIARLVAACAAAGLPKPRETATPGAALDAARSLAGRDGLICAAGSFFLAAEICRPG